MASVEYEHSILWRGEDPLKKKFKPAYDGSSKIVRYWPGKEPAWAHKHDEKGESTEPNRRNLGKCEDASALRLKRLKASELSGDTEVDKLLRHRILHDAQVLEAAPTLEDLKSSEGEVPCTTSDVSELEDDVTKSKLGEGLEKHDRGKARELALLKRKAEEEVLKVEHNEDEEQSEEEEEDSIFDSDSDDDPKRTTMLKPVFVAKTQRETVKEREAIKREDEETKERNQDRLQERKSESKILLINEIRQDEEAERNSANKNDASDVELLDDDDEKNEAEEYELWKIRELKRTKRDREERAKHLAELEWIEKRRSMTDEERAAEDKRLDEEAHFRVPTKQFTFMQKYYHRGGFFQDKATTGEEPLYLRDYHEGLDEEKFDKSLLPKVMQLRRGLFGKKSQVKHTHLTDVDTTDMTSAWTQQDKSVQRYQEKMATAKGVFVLDRPSSSKSSRPHS